MNILKVRTKNYIRENKLKSSFFEKISTMTQLSFFE